MLFSRDLKKWTNVDFSHSLKLLINYKIIKGANNACLLNIYYELIKVNTTIQNEKPTLVVLQVD